MVVLIKYVLHLLVINEAPERHIKSNSFQYKLERGL